MAAHDHYLVLLLSDVIGTVDFCMIVYSGTVCLPKVNTKQGKCSSSSNKLEQFSKIYIWDIISLPRFKSAVFMYLGKIDLTTHCCSCR